MDKTKLQTRNKGYKEILRANIKPLQNKSINI